MLKESKNAADCQGEIQDGFSNDFPADSICLYVPDTDWDEQLLAFKIEPSMPPQLRAFRAGDQEFLFRLYASTRLQELAAFGWPQAQQEAFLRMQFNAQKRWYEMSYAQADHQIIEQEGAAIGRLMVLREAASVLLVDIALLPEFRGQGIGGELVRKLIAECDQQKLPIRLQVQKANPAQRLYQRLGFRKTGEDQMYFQMEKLPG